MDFSMEFFMDKSMEKSTEKKKPFRKHCNVINRSREFAMNVKVEFYFAKYPRKVVPFSVSLTFNF